MCYKSLHQEQFELKTNCHLDNKVAGFLMVVKTVCHSKALAIYDQLHKSVIDKLSLQVLPCQHKFGGLVGLFEYLSVK